MVVIGHRGASHDFPENTIEAFRGARAQGANGVELDVRATRDHQLVVHHDAHLPDGRALAETDAGDLPVSVPTLRAALDACRPIGVNVEIKNSPGEPGYDASDSLVRSVLAVIDDCDPPLDILVSCFDRNTLDQVRDLAPHLPTGYLVLSLDEPVDAVAVAVSGGHRAVNPWDQTLTSAAVERCHEAGIEVNVWTVDDPARIVELASWGVDSVITNRPAVAVDALRRV